MEALHKAGFPVPKPFGHSRHLIAMEYIGSIETNQPDDQSVNDDPSSAMLLANVRREDLRIFAGASKMSFEQACALIYNQLMELIVQLARNGLIHGDFNEFNLMLKVADNLSVVMIDFPQMVSTQHPNAREYFERDVKGVRVFFARRFGYGHCHEEDDEEDTEDISEDVLSDAVDDVVKVEYPVWSKVKKLPRLGRLDVQLRASGWSGHVKNISQVESNEDFKSSASDYQSSCSESDATSLSSSTSLSSDMDDECDIKSSSLSGSQL